MGQAVCLLRVVPTADTQWMLDTGGRRAVLGGQGRPVSCSQTPFESSASREGTEGSPPPNLCPTAPAAACAQSPSAQHVVL